MKIENNPFKAAVRKRESIRLKLQLSSAPGIIEKEIQNKIKIEESVCQVKKKLIVLLHPIIIENKVES